MDPYISNTVIGSKYDIMTTVDKTCGRWPPKSIHDLCGVVRRCLKDKPMERATIEDVSSKLIVDVLYTPTLRFPLNC